VTYFSSPGDDESPPAHRPLPATDSDTGSLRWPARQVLLVVGLVMAILVAAYVGALVAVGDDIPRGVTVAGVEIGGLTAGEAVERLDETLGPRGSEFEVSLEGETRKVSAERAGLAFDSSATVATIPERSLNPWVLINQVGSEEVPPVVVVQQRQLDKAVAALARRVDDPVRQGVVRYDGLEVVAVEPRPGLALDRAAAAAAIRSGYLVRSDPIDLPVGPVEPEVSAAQVQEVAAGPALEAISAPVTLQIDGQTLTVTPEQIAASLSFRASGESLEPTVNVNELRQQLGDVFSAVGSPARDATFDVSSGKPVVVPAKNGRGVTDESLRTGLVEAIGSADRTAELTLERIPADLTTAEAKDLGIKRVISTFTQPFPYAAYRVTNIGVASKKISGTVLEPGEAFSLNGVVGERTPENGFVKGYIIVGNRLVEDYGGAVSTITTAMWHSAFFAGMTRIEQRAHGFWISRYTPGLEATVSWGNLDLKFRNDTPYGVLITSSVTDTSVTVTMWSTKYWDIDAEFGPRTNPRPAGTVYDSSEGCVAQYGVDGFDITVTRVWSRDGEVKRREPLNTSYSSAPTVICEPKPSPEPDPTKSDDKPKPSDKPSQDGGGSGGGGSGGGSG
jgi:vancomycin resistance protein YoaR